MRRLGELSSVTNMYSPRSVTLKIFISALLVALVAIAFLGSLDSIGKNYTESGTKRALMTFGVARGLNGVISVAQGTEIAIQPAGIGVNFTPGQILDPINDLIERFSWVMLSCGVSLGIQQILLDITVWPGFTLLIAFACLIALWLLWRPDVLGEKWRYRVYKAAAVLIIIRFAVPTVAIANEGIYQFFLAPQYESSRQELEKTSEAIANINREAQPEVMPQGPNSLLDNVKRLYESASYQINIDARIEKYKAAATHVSENTLNLIVVFILQTIAFPLLFFWLIVKFIRKISDF